MGRFIIRTFSEDIKNFKNMLPYRKKIIEEAEAAPLPKTYGVNELSEILHPDKQNVYVGSAVAIDNKSKIITLSSCEKTALAFFRPGQGINIRIGNETTFFPIASAPNQKDYKIIVSADSLDGVSKFLFCADENTALEISGPTGLFYYSHLRDGDSVVLICDVYGAASVLSICSYLVDSTDVKAEVFLLDKDENSKIRSLFENLSDNISITYVKNANEIYEKALVQVNSPSAFFVSGKQDFCEKTDGMFGKSDFLKGRIRMQISEPSIQNDVPADKYNCQVLYRNESFSFDCVANETLLSAFERNNIPTQAKCKVGECGYCRCKLLEGKVETVLCNGIDSRRSADEKYGFIHPCRAFPKADIKVKL